MRSVGGYGNACNPRQGAGRPQLILENFTAKLGGFTAGPMSLRLEAGEVLAFIGPNGSGKTTLLKGMAGLLPTSGRAEFCGRGLPGGAGRGGLVEYVPAEPQADPYARVREVFEVSGIDLDLVAERFPEIESYLDRQMRELSMGQRRLVCIVRGLSSRRPILLLDEPLSHLDVARQVAVAREIRREALRGRLVIVAMHELHMLGEIADRIVLLDGGRPVFAEPLGTLKNVIGLIEEVYGVKMRLLSAGPHPIILPASDER